MSLLPKDVTSKNTYYSVYTGLHYDVNNQSITFSRLIDISVLSIVLFFAFDESRYDGNSYFIINGYINNVENIVNEPMSIGILFLIITVLYGVIFIANVPMTIETKSVSISIMEVSLWLLLFFILFLELFKRAFDTNLTNPIFKSLRKFLLSFYSSKEVPKEESKKKPGKVPKKVPKDKSEVFHVSNNLYDYEEAQSICKSFDSRLATYDEVESTYKKGGEFCGYGWSAGQMILFPTQKSTFDKLQLIPEHKNDCGRTGVNGGYVSNPALKYGVNCFGMKKKGVDPKEKKFVPHNSINEDIKKAKVKYWAKHQDKFLNIAPFSRVNINLYWERSLPVQ